MEINVFDVGHLISSIRARIRSVTTLFLILYLMNPLLRFGQLQQMMLRRNYLMLLEETLQTIAWWDTMAVFLHMVKLVQERPIRSWDLLHKMEHLLMIQLLWVFFREHLATCSTKSGGARRRIMFTTLASFRSWRSTTRKSATCWTRATRRS